MNHHSQRVIKAYSAFVACFCMVGCVYAQDAAFQERTHKRKLTNSSHPSRLVSKPVPLIDALHSLEARKHVSFAYQRDFLEGKTVIYNPDEITDLEAYLTQVLTPLHLAFKKVEGTDDLIYVIYPQREKQPDAITKIVKKKFSGRVINERGEGILGVNVFQKAQGTGVITDENGNYTIELLPQDQNILVFSHIGYQVKEASAQDPLATEVMLVENTAQLSEVVVTALGISRNQKALGYSVSTIGSSQITQAGNTNFASALYGKASGVRIRTAPGGATSAVTVQVRGLNSLNYNAQPLYIIDGVVMRDGNEKGAAGVNNTDYFTDSRIRGNGILDINPADIETVSVLKGAGATALYGSDAANGVVVITTKKGDKKNGLGVDINYTVSAEQVAFTPHFQNIYGPGFDRDRNISLGADAAGWVPVDTDNDGVADTKRPLFESYAQFGPKMDGQSAMWWDGKTHSYSAHPNNYKDFYRTGYNAMFNASVSDKFEKYAYRVSYSRNDYEGIQVGGRLQRNTVNLNNYIKISNRLTADVVLNYTNSLVHNRPLKINRITGSWDGFFSRAEDMKLFFEKYKTTKGYKWVPYDQAQRDPQEALHYVTPRGFEVMNFLWKQLRDSEDERQNRLISSVTLHYQFNNNLSFRGKIGNDFTSLSTKAKGHSEYPSAFNVNSSTGSYSVSSGRYSIFYTDALLTYTKALSSDFSLTANGGFQLRDEQYRDQVTATGSGLVVENWFSLNNSYSASKLATETQSLILKYAFLGLINANYKDYLFFEATARQEYSSTLAPGKNSYFYPSVNSGFVFSEVMNLPQAISYAKLRASYGVVGNAPPVYEANILYDLSALQTSNGSVIAATAQGSLYGNNNIRPENKYETEFGVETKWFENKIGVDLTYYSSKIRNQILKKDLPSSAGASKILTNIGELRNSGWELGINTTLATGKFSWSTAWNVAVNSSRVYSLGDGVDKMVFRDMEGSSIQVVAERGQSIGNIYVYPRKTDAQGNFVINDKGLYIIDKTRYVKAGNMLPKVTGGFMNTFRFKNISLDVAVDYSLGGKIISAPLKYGMGSGMYKSTLQYRTAETGGLPYYINGNGAKVLLSSQDMIAPDGGQVYHDGVVLKGVTESGTPNSTVIDAATYYLNTFDWGSNSWNEAGAIYNNSYVKMREVVLSYSLPLKATNKLHFQSIRVSLIGRNLFYIWRTLENLDPESTIGTNWLNQGIDEGSNAATRSYGFSVNMSF
ncbi:MAG TPA: SusC/RagA family TonB-linked outer membrane protein [Ohtaekwangia sp.]|uniref:SusC/RagA family TonB-linked outer membrane protein n=1 Tax=Ohtaekwangia sp. TaxID=2066019 RepID=UPI002F91EDBB